MGCSGVTGEDSTELQGGEGLRRWVRVLRYVFTPACFVFIGFLVVENRPVLQHLAGRVDAEFFLLAVVIWSAVHLMGPFTVLLVIGRDNPWLSYQQALVIHVSRLPAKYLPGGIWHTVVRFTDYHAQGVEPQSLYRLLYLESILPAVITLSLGALLLEMHGISGGWVWPVRTCAVVGILGLALVPVILNRLLSARAGKIAYPDYLSLCAVIAVFWISASGSFLAYFHAYGLVESGATTLALVGTYIFSWGIGYITIFAPQGIGVFEFVAGSLLELPINLGSIAVVIAGFRVVVFLGDMIAWLGCQALVAVFGGRQSD